MARDDDAGGQRVQDGEDGEAHHQLVEFVGPTPGQRPRAGPAAGSAAARRLLEADGAPDAEERNEAGTEQQAAGEEVDGEGRDDEPAEAARVLPAHVAHARQRVAVDGRRAERRDGLHGGRQPRG